jgi:hypothetical protein
MGDFERGVRPAELERADFMMPPPGTNHHTGNNTPGRDSARFRSVEAAGYRLRHGDHGLPAHLRPEPYRSGIRLIVMTASRWLATRLAAMTVLAALAAGCASATSAPPATAAKERAPATASFSVMGLAFRYPLSWQRSRTWSTDLPGSSTLIVYLSSTSRLRAPCVASTSPGRIAQTCEYPVRVLPPEGVLVRWSADEFSAWRMPKANATIAGRKAAEIRTSGGWCAPMRATETITVIIPRATPGTWYQMDACLRAPGLPQQQAQISSMLRSVRIAKGN